MQPLHLDEDQSGACLDSSSRLALVVPGRARPSIDEWLRRYRELAGRTSFDERAGRGRGHDQRRPKATSKDALEKDVAQRRNVSSSNNSSGAAHVCVCRPDPPLAVPRPLAVPHVQAPLGPGVRRLRLRLAGVQGQLGPQQGQPCPPPQQGGVAGRVPRAGCMHRV